MSGTGKYIGGSFVVAIGNVLTIVGIILGIWTFLEYNGYTLAAAVILVIIGVIVSTIGVSIRGRRGKKEINQYISH